MATDPSDQDKLDFANAALEQLSDDQAVQQFEDNVKQVGTWANQVDASFDTVTRKFEQMVETYGKQFPGFSSYKDEWVGFDTRWVALLSKSRDVASEHVAILKRFDKVYLDMVQAIVTEQDRLDVIKELQVFIDEPHDDSIAMSNGFLTLKRDIVDFIGRLYQWITDQGTQLENEAKQLKLDIDTLQGEIEELDGKIETTTKALAACGICLCLIGVVVAGSVLAAYKTQRNDKADQLLEKQKALKDVNDKQQALANLKSDYDGMQPDISLICEKLVLFAEIWSSVRSQSIEFQNILKGGLGAVTNMGFKAQVRLAQATCQPLENGLEKYATELENRKTT
ncbi:hypothetical protein MD484_g3870, partial [Candolleomyces efflorescens]